MRQRQLWVLVAVAASLLAGCTSSEAMFHARRIEAVGYERAWDATYETIEVRAGVAHADKSLGYVASPYLPDDKHLTPLDVPVGFVSPEALHNRRKRVIGRVTEDGAGVLVRIQVQEQREEHEVGQEFSSSSYDGMSTGELTAYKHPDEVGTRWMPDGSDDAMAQTLLEEIAARLTRP